MSIYSTLFEIALRLKDKLKGKGVFSLYDQLKVEQLLPHVQIKALQEKRLNNLLVHASEKSPYYKNLFLKHKIKFDQPFKIEHLEYLPLLTREDIQNHLDEIKCPDVTSYKDSSGGSTGSPVNFYHDDNYARWSEAFNMLFLSWMDIKPGDKTAIFWGADRDLKDLSAGDKFYNKIYRLKQLNSFSMTEQNISEFIDELNQFMPSYIYGYASSLFLAAEFINKNKLSVKQPKAVRSSAEMLYDFQREEIEKAFGACVYNFYGSREVNNIAAECSDHDGLHIFSSGRIVEIVNENGEKVPDGKVGMIAVTDLTNFAFPFIRYLNGDLASFGKDDGFCSCGRNLKKLIKIEGRSSDMIIVNGQFIHGEYFTHLFYNRPDIKQFQLVQEEDGSLNLLLVSDSDELNTDRIVKSIKNKVGEEVILKISKVENIPPSSSGKHRFTISKLATTIKK